MAANISSWATSAYPQLYRFSFRSYQVHLREYKMNTVQVRTKRTKTYAYNASGPNAYTRHGRVRSKLISMYELAHCFRIVDISLLF